MLQKTDLNYINFKFQKDKNRKVPLSVSSNQNENPHSEQVEAGIFHLLTLKKFRLVTRQAK